MFKDQLQHINIRLCHVSAPKQYMFTFKRQSPLVDEVIDERKTGNHIVAT